MSSTEQDDYIRYLVASEIAHSQAAMDGEDTSEEGDFLNRWGLLLVVGFLAASTLFSLVGVFLAMGL